MAASKKKGKPKPKPKPKPKLTGRDRPAAGQKGSGAATCLRAAELADLTPREARAHRLERIAALVGEGVRLRKIYRTIVAEYGVVDRTVRKDFRDLGRECRERLERPESLHVEVDQALARIRARATDPTTPPPIAQRADEYLMRLLSAHVDRLTAVEYGHNPRRHEAQLAQLQLEREAARVELAQAEAQLARARSAHVEQPLVVVLRDLAGDVSRADLAAASPTFADLHEGES